jgi:hypothetical protein
MADRTITIKFKQDPLDPPDVYSVDITYRKKDIDHGDKLEWIPRGDVPPNAVVSVANFRLKEGSPGLFSYSNGKATPLTPTPPPVNADGLSIDTKGFDLGHYKYDIKIGTKVIMDPDLEIKGPKAG